MNKREIDFCNKKKENPSFYNEIRLNKLKAPITVLLGPNGTGKTTSIRLMQEQLKKQEYVTYATKRDDIVGKATSVFGEIDPVKLSSIFHSEGERMHDSFTDWCTTVLIPKVLKTTEKLYVFIDELDSGLSLDKIISQIALINLIAREEEKRKTGRVKFVLTSNSYEVLDILNKELSDFIWLPSKQKINIKSYKTFRKKYIEYYKYMNKED